MELKIDKELEVLDYKIEQMVDETKKSFDLVLEAFKDDNKDLALKIIRRDEEINKLDVEISDEVINFIISNQPVATDLRHIMVIELISIELERIADYATNIAKYIIRDVEVPGSKSTVIMTEMISNVKEMLTEILFAYKTQDANRAKYVVEKNALMHDSYKLMIKKNLLRESIIEKYEIEDIVRATIAVRELDRAGDHIVNIAEHILYYVKGKRYDLS